MRHDVSVRAAWRWLRVVATSVAATLLVNVAAAQPCGGTQDLGTLGGNYYSNAYGVSADGSVVVGWSYDALFRTRAFRWTSSGGKRDLGTLGGSSSIANAVSADGGVVVGWAYPAAGNFRAFSWTAAGGIRELGTPWSGKSSATGVSADGGVVVGWAYNAVGESRAVRWTAAGEIQDLGTLEGTTAGATGVSADGKVVVGWAKNAAGDERAFRWTVAGGMRDLGTLGGWASRASRVSADGGVVVGQSYNAAAYSRAFRWTPAGGMQDLGTLGGTSATAFDVSADGSVVVGGANDSLGEQAFRWTSSGGMQSLRELGWNISTAYGVSADGGIVAGRAIGNSTYGERAFRWTQPCGPIRWRQANSGRFDDATNWSPAFVPGLGNTALIDAPGSYNVTLDSNRSVDSIQIGNAVNLTIGGPGRTLASAMPIRIGNGSSRVSVVLEGTKLATSANTQIGPSSTLSLKSVSSPGQPFAQFATLTAPGGVEVAGTLEGGGIIEGNVTNKGAVAPKLLAGALDKKIKITGDYLTIDTPVVAPSYTPRLSIEVANDNGSTVSQLEATGLIRLGGTLRVVNAAGFADWSAGSTIRPCVLVQQGSSGRFDQSRRFVRVEGLGVSSSKSLFVNHDYQNARAMIGTEKQPVQLCLIEAPELFRGSVRQRLFDVAPPSGQRSLMFVTHGTQSSIPDENESQANTFAELAKRAAMFAATHGLSSDWDIVTLDWGPYSTNLGDGNYNPWESARISNDIAESLVATLRDRWTTVADPRLYSRYHLLSHSSGSYLVDRMAVALAREGLSSRNNVWLTFFDAFSGPPGARSLGLAAGVAEHYADRSTQILDGLPFTDDPLSGMPNIDVTRQRCARGPLDSHSWPYIWYSDTIDAANSQLPNCSSPLSYWGFAQSPLARDVLAKSGSTTCLGSPPEPQVDGFYVLPGNRCDLSPSGWRLGVLASSQASTTGTVRIASNGDAELTTGSPVSVAMTYSLPSATEFVRFRYEFVAGSGTGAVQVSSGSSTIFQSLGSADTPGQVASGPIRLPSVAGPGPVTISFRLDPLTSNPSTIRITGVEFSTPACPADFDADGFLTFEDFDSFVTAFESGGSNADTNGDGFLTFEDFDAFVSAFEAGC